MNIETAAQVIICALQQEFELGNYFEGKFCSFPDSQLEAVVIDVLKKILEKEEIKP